jgi:hypothetical protein
MASEGVPLIVIQRQLGHSNLGITSIQGIDNAQIIETVHARPRPDESSQHTAAAPDLGSCGATNTVALRA